MFLPKNKIPLFLPPIGPVAHPDDYRENRASGADGRKKIGPVAHPDNYRENRASGADGRKKDWPRSSTE